MQDERDPEADAEFDRELAKLMAEGLDSRKAERRPVFDIPLPMRRGPREAVSTAEDSGGEAPPPRSIMKFSLLSKRGNKQQVCSPGFRRCSYTDMIDSIHRSSGRFELCRCNALAAAGRTGRTTTN